MVFPWQHVSSFYNFYKNQFLTTFFYHKANRTTTMHDFGYVALNMKYVNPEDSGTYTCRAMNELGQAVTSASLIVQCKYNVTMMV